jgi:hypothetical protein
MAEESELVSNVLEFARRSFAFDRVVDWDGTPLAVFHRTETESESRFRPRILRLELVLPTAWIVYDPATELLRLGKDGRVLARGDAGTAMETAAEASEFEEGGIAFRRTELPGRGFLYAPTEWAERILRPDGRARLGLPADVEPSPARDRAAGDGPRS